MHPSLVKFLCRTFPHLISIFPATATVIIVQFCFLIKDNVRGERGVHLTFLPMCQFCMHPSSTRRGVCVCASWRARNKWHKSVLINEIHTRKFMLGCMMKLFLTFHFVLFQRVCSLCLPTPSNIIIHPHTLKSSFSPIL
jgi:hypothetical protein